GTGPEVLGSEPENACCGKTTNGSRCAAWLPEGASGSDTITTARHAAARAAEGSQPRQSGTADSVSIDCRCRATDGQTDARASCPATGGGRPCSSAPGARCNLSHPARPCGQTARCRSATA